MNKQQFIEWVEEIKERMPFFLADMKGEKRAGFYKYSFSGDVWGEGLKWGLGNSVFALKIMYSLRLDIGDIPDVVHFVESFQRKDGSFFDPLVRNSSFALRTYFSLKRGTLKGIPYRDTIRAETRQSISTLKSFGITPGFGYEEFPQSVSEIDAFLSKQEWTVPWAANAHLSGLLFFISTSELANKLELIEYAVSWVTKLQREDGAWYTGNPALSQKINGAMKYMTALKAATVFANYNQGVIQFERAKELIDMALLAVNDKHACDNFNIAYALRYACEVEGTGYRSAEIDTFFEQRLDSFKQYYYPEKGGFSFNPSKSSTNYYGSPLTWGKDEPDIHGTMLFVWGLSVIGGYWKLNESLGLQEFVS